MMLDGLWYVFVVELTTGCDTCWYSTVLLFLSQVEEKITMEDKSSPSSVEDHPLTMPTAYTSISDNLTCIAV